MKRILLFKRIDLYAQLIIPVIDALLTRGNLVDSFLLLLSYQVCSCIANEILLKGEYKSVVRRIYEWMFAVLAIIFFSVYHKNIVNFSKFAETVNFKVIIVILIGLFSPIIAIMYFMLSVEEIGIIDDARKSTEKNR